MQATIAQQLALDLCTVANFFMNARRRGSDRYTADDTEGEMEEFGDEEEEEVGGEFLNDVELSEDNYSSCGSVLSVTGGGALVGPHSGCRDEFGAHVIEHLH